MRMRAEMSFGECALEARKPVVNRKDKLSEEDARVSSVLAYLAEHPGALRREIWVTLGLAEGTLWRALRTLRARGWVEVCNSRSKSDHGTARVYRLTPEGVVEAASRSPASLG